MKLHLGCGTVYLEDYINIDVFGQHISLASPSESEINSTTLDRYYKHELCNHPNNLTFYDLWLDLFSLNRKFQINTIDEILWIGSIEHFLNYDALNILCQCYQILKPNRCIHLNFPNIIKTLEMLNDSNSLLEIGWVMRLIYGSYRNKYNIHKWGYTQDSMYIMLQDAGFDNIIFETKVSTEYPMIGVSCIK